MELVKIAKSHKLTKIPKGKHSLLFNRRNMNIQERLSVKNCSANITVELVKTSKSHKMTKIPKHKTIINI